MISNNRLKQINIKSRAHYYFDNSINVNDFNPKNIKVDKKLYKSIFIYSIGYETPNGVKPLHINFNKVNGYIKWE